MCDDKKDKFIPGDVVMAKFGTFEMTVAWRMANRFGTEITPNRYFCQWFCNGELREGIFPEASLMNCNKQEQQEERK